MGGARTGSRTERFTTSGADSEGGSAWSASEDRPLPPDDFAALSYTDEQKAEIDKIRVDNKSRKDVVAKDDKLTADQKDATLLGFTPMEYGRIY